MKKVKLKSKKAKICIGIFMCLGVFAMNFPAQSGGQFAVTQSVIAGGGAASNGGNFGVTGTIAQTNAGDNSSGGQFLLKSGFWQADFAPTAANVSVSGKVTTADGSGIKNARLTLTGVNGNTQTAVTGAFGYFNFAEVPVGETYILTVHSKRFTFAGGTLVLFLAEGVNDVIFIADSQ